MNFARLSNKLFKNHHWYWIWTIPKFNATEYTERTETDQGLFHHPVIWDEFEQCFRPVHFKEKKRYIGVDLLTGVPTYDDMRITAIYTNDMEPLWI